MVISFERSNNKVLTMLITLKKSTAFSYSILNSDFIFLYIVPTSYQNNCALPVYLACHSLDV